MNTDELESQIHAQDCELEYWFQQAENYAEVQIPADDLRAIIARAYAAVNALPELLAKVKRYEDALDEIEAQQQYLRVGGAYVDDTGQLEAGLERAVEIARAALKETGATEVFQELAKKQEPLGAEFEAAIGDPSTLYET